MRGSNWNKRFVNVFSFRGWPVAMRRGNPRPLPSSSSRTIQLLPGWWAVVLSSVELSISTISQMLLLLLLQKVRTPTTNKNSSTSKHQTFTFQLLPGWWAVVLSSVELSIRIKYNVKNFSRYESCCFFFFRKSKLLRWRGWPSLPHQTFTTPLVSICFKDVSPIHVFFTNFCSPDFFGPKSGRPSISSLLWCLHPALWDGSCF